LPNILLVTIISYVWEYFIDFFIISQYAPAELPISPSLSRRKAHAQMGIKLAPCALSAGFRPVSDEQKAAAGFFQILL
jgi:hypothetical protein